ncbi:uncharacterized protein JCM15063_006239 [Sporobolomyces koalae]|uniref:uncharacterized protein n=1 Tax=Sporobolomyces koalae TaxID=500713 RepID=UPI00316CD86E
MSPPGQSIMRLGDLRQGSVPDLPIESKDRFNRRLQRLDIVTRATADRSLVAPVIQVCFILERLTQDEYDALAHRPRRDDSASEDLVPTESCLEYVIHLLHDIDAALSDPYKCFGACHEIEQQLAACEVRGASTLAAECHFQNDIDQIKKNLSDVASGLKKQGRPLAHLAVAQLLEFVYKANNADWNKLNSVVDHDGWSSAFKIVSTLKHIYSDFEQDPSLTYFARFIEWDKKREIPKTQFYAGSRNEI